MRLSSCCRTGGRACLRRTLQVCFWRSMADYCVWIVNYVTWVLVSNRFRRVVMLVCSKRSYRRHHWCTLDIFFILFFWGRGLGCIPMLDICTWGVRVFERVWFWWVSVWWWMFLRVRRGWGSCWAGWRAVCIRWWNRCIVTAGWRGF